MSEHQLLTALWTGLFFLVHLVFVARSILRPHREPASRVAWVVVIHHSPDVEQHDRNARAGLVNVIQFD
jgi:cardiolipin synthase